MVDKKINSISFNLIDLNGKDCDCLMQCTTRPDASPQDVYNFSALLYGLYSLFMHHPEFVFSLGEIELRAARPDLFESDEEDDEDMFQVVFEADEDLKQALMDRKIVPFNKKKLN